jgi:hypothetical protein
MIYLVRKIRASRRNKRDAQNAANAPTLDNGVDDHRLDEQHVETGHGGVGSASGATVTEHVEAPKEPARSSWQIWKPRILLLTAVFLPVFLETLDYTGT